MDISEINIFIKLALPVIGSFLLIFIGYTLRKFLGERKIKSAEIRAKNIIEKVKKETQRKREEVAVEAKNLMSKRRSEFEKETRGRKEELLNLEKKLRQKEENLDRKVEILDKKEKDVGRLERTLSQKEQEIVHEQNELQRIIVEEKQRLQRVSGLTPEEAKKILLSKMESDVRKEASIMIRDVENKARAEANKKAKEVISLAIQRCATEHTSETTISVVNLPNDEMKGRIIGREGRNIRALEMATGVDIIIDDTPEAVTISGFDVIKREIAKITLENLIQDGRIHPGRIEEVVEKVRKEMQETIKEEGEKACLDIDIHGLHPELIKYLGKLKYRTSYGQNALQHSKEVALLMGILASELGLDFSLARRMGILHDIGKAVDQEVEGTHAKIGADMLRKFGESEVIIYALSAHHEDVEISSIYDPLLQAADAISSSRPGARRETLETYIKRLGKLESIADSFQGVEKTYAIQAGREIRVIVQPNKVSDEETVSLAREIKKKVEEGLEYPGQIKVTVIRETRTIEYAK